MKGVPGRGLRMAREGFPWVGTLGNDLAITRYDSDTMGAWQAALAYALLVASLAALIAKFGSSARPWS